MSFKRIFARDTQFTRLQVKGMKPCRMEAEYEL